MQNKGCLIILLNFGSAYIKKLEDLIKSQGVKVKVVKPTVSTSELEKADGIVISGSNYSVFDKNAPIYNKQVFFLKKPVFGICYGQQLMAHALGGKVEKIVKDRVIAKRKLKITEKSVIFKGLKKEEIVWMEHEDGITKLPEGFYSIAESKESKIAAMENKEKLFFGVQFHPEAKSTENGKKIIENFILQVSCNKN